MSMIKRLIDDVYADYEDGKTVKDICKKYRITEDMVNEIIKLMSNEES